MVKFTARIEPSGRCSDIAIDGQSLPNVRAFSIHANVNEVSKLMVEMLLLEPFEINGEADIIVATRVVNKEIAKKTYENLKRYFKEGVKEDEN